MCRSLADLQYNPATYGEALSYLDLLIQHSRNAFHRFLSTIVPKNVDN